MEKVYNANPLNCRCCGRQSVRPKIIEVNNGVTINTEAQYVCPNCGSRFYIGILESRPIVYKSPE